MTKQTWNTKELQDEFTVNSFSYGIVFVTRKSDGASGTLEFEHAPRVYYNFIKTELETRA